MFRKFHPDHAQQHLRAARSELRAAWRSGTLPHWRMVLAPMLALGVLGSVLPGPWRWIAGLSTGLGVAAWLLLGERFVRIERWRSRIGSAHRTARLVDRLLDDGWLLAPTDGLVLHGLGGAFLLESVAWSGTVVVADGAPTRTFVDDPDGAVAMTGLPLRMRRLAADCADGLGATAEVTPVVVIWGDFPAGAVVEGDVAYVRGDRLGEWLGSRRPRLRALPTVIATAA